jgi:hypothetical protein
VEVGDLPIVEYKPFRWMIEGVFVVEDALLQVMDAVVVMFLGNGGVSFTVCDGLKQSICNGPEEGSVEVRLCPKRSLDSARREGEWGQGQSEARRKLDGVFVWQLV